MNCGCDRYDGQRPCDYPNTKWICKQPDIFFKVDKNIKLLGEIKVNGEVKPVIVRFDYGNGISVFPYNSPKDETFIDMKHRYLEGSCSFNKNYLIVKINDDALFNNKYKELTFKRENLTDD